MNDTSFQQSLYQTLVPLLMLSRQRNHEQAEAVLEKRLGEGKPELLSELVGLTIDQLIEDLMVLECHGDYEIPLADNAFG